MIDILTARFWDTRHLSAAARREPHRASWDVSEEDWNAAREGHRRLLASLIRPRADGMPVRVLDYLCGCGDLRELMPSDVPVDYVGVTPSRYGWMHATRHEVDETRYEIVDPSALPFEGGSFDVAIARSVEGTVIEQSGQMAWRRVEREILRVANRLVLLTFGRPDVARVVDSVASPEVGGVIVRDGGRLEYRVGQDSTVEIFDLMVDEDRRGRGVGRAMVEELAAGYWCVFAFTRAGNDGARAFYRALGFTETPLPGFYRGEDGVMVTRVTDGGLLSGENGGAG